MKRGAHPSILGRVMLGLLMVLLTACAVRPPGETAPPTAAPSSALGELVIATDGLITSNALAEVYHQALLAKGIPARVETVKTSLEETLPRIETGSIAIMPIFAGTALAALDPGNAFGNPDEIASDLASSVDDAAAVLRASKVRGDLTYVVPDKLATDKGIRDIADLKKIAATSILAGPAGAVTRPDGPPGLKAVYGVTFKKYQPIEFTGSRQHALTANEAQVAMFPAADRATAAPELTVLTDSEKIAIPDPQVVLLNHQVSEDVKVLDAIEPVQDKLTNTDLIAFQQAADQPAAILEWLKTKGLA